VRDVLDDLAAQHAELRELLDGLTGADWARPSRCDGWTVADVVLHLAQTDELAVASASGRFDAGLAELASGVGPAVDVDDGAGRMVERDRGAPPAAVFARWRAASEGVDAVLAGADPHERVQWVAGRLTARTLASTRLAECWIHTGDVGSAFGIPPSNTPRLRHVARLAWRTLPYAFTRAGRELSGPVEFRLGEWVFSPEEPAATVVTGDALDLCLVAGQRADARDTGLRGEGPDADAVLELVRTFA
jgi:uncharacterized protein (TIGR03084 family)